MVAYVSRCQWARFAVPMALGAILCGCVTIQGGPDRLYPIESEVAQARGLLEGVDGLVAEYYAIKSNDPNADNQRKFYRNEIITRRMYIIDVEYSEYEAALTSERQKFGFLTTTAATGLGIASTLTTPIRSAQVLSGVGAAVLGTRGAYDTEVVIAKTLQIVQGHMRAQRDNVAARQILPRLTESPVTYPLSAALHDLEDYYRAGTFTAGLIPALRESGAAAQLASEEKVLAVSTFSPDASTAILAAYLRPNGGRLNRERLDKLNGFLKVLGQKFDVRAILTRADSALVRAQLIQLARGRGEPL
jgi:hypothetical protein